LQTGWLVGEHHSIYMFLKNIYKPDYPVYISK